MKKLRRGVLGVIYRIKNDRHEFLLLRRMLHWKGWEFPKGGVKEGESEENALKREIEEETGLRTMIVSMVPHGVSYSYPEDFESEFAGAHQDVYLVKCLDGDVRLSYEHDGFIWCDYEEAMQLLTHEGQKEALEAAFRILKD